MLLPYSDNAIGLSDAQKLDIEDKSGASGDARLIPLAVCLLGGEVDFPAVTHVHLLQGYNPARDKVAQAESRSCGAAAGIKRLAVDGFADIMGCDDAAAVWCRPIVVARLYHLKKYSFVEGFHSGLLSFFSEPCAVSFDVFLFCHRV